jgi:hypothetical protein
VGRKATALCWLPLTSADLLLVPFTAGLPEIRVSSIISLDMRIEGIIGHSKNECERAIYIH